MSVAPLDQAADLREAVRLWRAERIMPTVAPSPAISSAAIPMARPISLATHTTLLPPPVVAISSGKGGVGKTHLAVNLALCFSQRGRRVLLLDADAGTANDDLLLGVDPSPGLADLLADRCRPEHAARLVAPGLRFVAGSSGGGGQVDAVLADESRLTHTLARLAQGCDLVLLDCGAGVGPTVRAPVAACDLLLLVTTPERTALTDAYALVKTLHQNRWWPAAPTGLPAPSMSRHRSHRAAVIVNQVAGNSDAREVSNRLRSVAHRFLGFDLLDAGFVRTDRHVPESLRRRRPFVEAYPRCHAARDLATLAERIGELVPAHRHVL